MARQGVAGTQSVRDSVWLIPAMSFRMVTLQVMCSGSN